MRWRNLAIIIVALSFIVPALASLVPDQSILADDGIERASVAATFSPEYTIFSATGVRYVDGDIAKGSNYFYAFADQYSTSGSVQFSRSADGLSWSAPTALFSALNYPHGGFCAYNVGSSDQILISVDGSIKKSVNNGTSFSSLTSIGALLDYPTVVTNASMDSSRSYDNNIYVAGNVGTNGIYLRKSVNDGASWSSSYTIMNTQASSPILIRNNTVLYCLFRYDVGSDYNIYVKNSSDWGKTWGSATKAYSKTLGAAIPCRAQYINEQRCLLTIADISNPPYSNCKGVYGYFWYRNNTFQQIGYETGAAFNDPDASGYCGIISPGPFGLNYTSLWCYMVDASNYVIKTHYSYDSGLNITLPLFVPAPVITNSPSPSGGIGIQYSFNASATFADSGSSVWSLSKNASWLSLMWSDNTHCLLQGTPTSRGSYWVNLTISDSNSSDYINWTISVTDVTAPTCTIVSPATDPFYTSSSMIDLAGIAYDNIDVTNVTWSNSMTGGSGECIGTTSWSATAILLAVGSNLITVTAHDAAGNTGSDTVLVLPPEETGCTITTPASSPTYVKATPYTSMAGTASGMGIVSVTWENSRGGSGTAVGTASWTIPSIPLSAGSNVITVTSHDAIGGTASATTTLIYDPTAPTCAITFPSTSPYYTKLSTLNLAGWASDNLLVQSIYWEAWYCTEVDMGPGMPPEYVWMWEAYGYASITPGNYTDWNIPYTFGTYADYRFDVTASDAAGNSNKVTTYATHCPDYPMECLIDFPTTADSYNTELPTIQVRGWVGGYNHDWIVEAYWSNAATGESGGLDAYEEYAYSFTWIAHDIGLNLGSNMITIFVRAFDGATGSDSINVIRDNETTPPICTITDPPYSGIWYAESPIWFSGIASDNIGVTSVTWYNAATNSSGTASGLETWEVGIPCNIGENTITVTAHDAAGNTGANTITIGYDNIPPICTITWPTTDPYRTNANSIVLSGTASDNIEVGYVHYEVWAFDPMFEGGWFLESYGQVLDIVKNGSLANWTFSLSLPFPSHYQVRMIPGDLTDMPNGVEDTISITRDAASPVCTISSPASGSYSTTSNTVDLSGSAYDYVKWPHDFEVILLGQVAYLTWTNAATGGSGFASAPIGSSVSWNISGIPLLEGDNLITITAYDWAGNSGSDAITVAYSTLTCNITSPTSSPTYFTNWGWVKLIGTATDDVTVTSVTWSNSLGGSGTMYMTPQFGGPSVSWQSRGQIQLYDGANVITVTAYDNEGHTATDVLTVTYEKVLPTVVITSPTSTPYCSVSSSTIDIAGTASDASGISTVVWKNVATGESGVAAGTESWSITGIPLVLGMNLIYVNATDSAGNKNYDAIWVTCDLDSLAVAITSPTSEPTMTTGWHYVKLWGDASDDNKVVLVTWSNNRTGDSGTMYMTPQFGGPSVTWQTRGQVHLLPGVNEITVTAYDEAGNTATDILSVTYTGA